MGQQVELELSSLVGLGALTTREAWDLEVLLVLYLMQDSPDELQIPPNLESVWNRVSLALIPTHPQRH